MDVIGLAAEALKPISDEGTIVQQGWYDESLKRLHVTLWKLQDTEDAHSDDECEIEAATKTTQTATLKGDFYARQMDGRYECSVDESNLLAEHTEAAAAIKDWFSKVQEKPDAA